MIHSFQINDNQTEFGLQLRLKQIKVFPLQNKILRDGLGILTHIFGIGLLLLMDQDHEGGRQGGKAGDG